MSHSLWNSSFQETHEALKKACQSWVWSRGVELARQGRVRLVRESPAEVSFTVEDSPGKTPRQVDFYPEDAEWSCDCQSREIGCTHASAAWIAFRKMKEEGLALAPVELGWQVRYRFREGEGGMWLVRTLVDGRGGQEIEMPLPGRVLASPDQPGKWPPRWRARPEDLEVEEVLGMRLPLAGGLVPREVWPRLLAALAVLNEEPGSAEVRRLVRGENSALRARSEPLGWRLVVRDQEVGVALFLECENEAAKLFENGVACLGESLYPLRANPLRGEELRLLRLGATWYAKEFERLVSEVLPTIEARVPVVIETRRLPARRRESLFVEVDTHLEGEMLVARAEIVYGDPPVARLREDRLIVTSGHALVSRDRDGEARLRDELWRYLAMEPSRKASWGGDQAVLIAERVRRVTAAQPHMFRLRGEGIKAFSDRGVLQVDLRLGAQGQMAARFHAEPSQSDEKPLHADSRDVLSAWKSGERFVRLSDGQGVARLPHSWLERFGARLESLLAAGEGQVLPKALWAEAHDFVDEAQGEIAEATKAFVARLRGGIAGGGEFHCEGLNATLRPYQRQGVSWLVTRRELGLGALLADDMGLGKTLQVIASLQGKTLVVAPVSVIQNWKSEIERFRPGMRVHVFHGSERVAWTSDADVVVTSYALLRMEHARLSASTWDCLVLDESQAIRNPDSQAAMAARKLGARWKVCLTGTPVENRLEDLWSQFHFLAPGLLGPRESFRAGFERAISAGDAEASRALRARVAPFLLRRLKSEVALDLPARTEGVLRVELSEDERGLYEALWALSRPKALGLLETGKDMLQVLEILLRLRQASCHSDLLPGREKGLKSPSSKLSVLWENLETVLAEGHKALVFSQWTSFLDLIGESLSAKGIGYSRLDGSTTDRARVVREFQEGEDSSVMLLSLKAGGVGLNLTRADHVFLMDPWWNPAVEEQALGRVHRIGQTRPVMLWRLVATGTIEERILELQARKRRLAEVSVESEQSEEGSWEGSLGREDLMGLFDPL